MLNSMQKFRQSSIVSEKAGILSEKLKTLTSFNYHRVKYFLLNFCTHFLLTNVYKMVFRVFLFYLDFIFSNNNFKAIQQIKLHLFEKVLFVAFCFGSYVKDLMNKFKQSSFYVGMMEEGHKQIERNIILKLPMLKILLIVTAVVGKTIRF